MKRSGFKNRGKGLERKTKLKAKRETQRRVAEHRARDDDYRRAVRGLACYMFSLGIDRGALLVTCNGPTDPDHQGKDRGAGLKSSDFDCVPMCRHHHDERQFMTGYFKGWTKDRMDAFCEQAVAATRARLGVVTGPDGKVAWSAPSSCP